MAKATTFCVSTLFGAAQTAIGNGATVTEATAQVQTHAARATLAECVAGFAGGEKAKKGITAGQQSLANRARTLLEKQKIDMEDASAIAEALRPLFWADEGMARPVNDAGKPCTPEEGTPERLAFQRVATNLGRMKHAIMGRVAPVKAKPRLSSKLVADIKAATIAADVSYADALAALKRVYGK